jgi:dTMP kinase
MASMFVTFEGVDGSGKSTQAELLRARLEAEGLDVVATREPGGTELGEKLRNLVLHGGHVSPWAEALMYAAARAQHVDEVIRPALERGATVICDRYVDSSVAYQGVGRELGLERVLDLNLAAVDGLMPDRTFLLELDVEAIGERLRREHDRLEREPMAFMPFARAMDLLIGMRGPDLLRVKGFLNVEGCRGPVVVQFVQHIAHPAVELEHWPTDDRATRVVFITRGVTEGQVNDLLAAVRALAAGAR